MDNQAKPLLEFGPFRIDPERRLLWRDQQPVPLSPKAFDLLLALAQRAGQVVLKDDLMKTLWPDTFVEESNLGQHVFQLRKALGERAQDHTFIVTVPGRGYRFAQKVSTVPVGAVESEEAEELVVESHSRSRLVIEEAGSGGALPAIPPGRRRVSWIVAVAALAVLLGTGYLIWWHYQSERAANPNRIMLAVMPFQNLTGDPEQEFFADGVTEEMITQLGRLHPEQLGVIARTSVMGYKHGDKRLDEIGRELSVQYVLEGSFRRTADRVRITAQLIRVKDQSHLWAEDYDRSLQDVITVQDDVAAAVAREIQLRLNAQRLTELSHTRTVDPQAYEDYLKGRFFWNKRTEDGFRKATEYFEAAIAKDPNYAQAYAGLADVYTLLGGYAFVPQKEAMPKAKAAALKALAIDDQLAEAYTSLGLIAEQYEWNWAESEKNYKRAIELNPNYSVAHHYYGDGYLPLVGRNDEMIAELRIAHELDPLSLIIDVDLAKRLCEVGKHDESMEMFRKILEADPNFDQAHFYLSRCYTRERAYPQAIAELEKIKPLDSHPQAAACLGQIYALTGRRKEATQIVDQLQQKSQRTYIDPTFIAYIYIALAEKDQGFAWLEKAYRERSPDLLGLKADSDYDPIRSDPRFGDLIRRVGIP